MHDVRRRLLRLGGRRVYGVRNRSVPPRGVTLRLEDLATACTYASPFASKAELVNTIASSYCLGGSRRHRSYVHGRQGRCDRELGC